MAVYTDFFIAEPEEIPRLFFPEDVRRRPHVVANNILPEVVADLDYLLTGKTDREPKLVREAGERLVYELADEFRDSVANLPDDRLSAVADEWSSGDEDSLRELRDLARIALTSHKSLYVYI